LLRVRLFIDFGVFCPFQLLAIAPEVFQERGADDGADFAALAGLDAAVNFPISIERQRVLAVFDIGYQSLQRGQKLAEIGLSANFAAAAMSAVVKTSPSDRTVLSERVRTAL
jgi:hypothetical protein